MLLDGQIGSNNYNRLKPMFPRWRGGRSSGSSGIPVTRKYANCPRNFTCDPRRVAKRERTAFFPPTDADLFALSFRGNYSPCGRFVFFLFSLSLSLSFSKLKRTLNCICYRQRNVDLIYGYGMMTLFLRSREILSPPVISPVTRSFD